MAGVIDVHREASVFPFTCVSKYRAGCAQNKTGRESIARIRVACFFRGINYPISCLAIHLPVALARVEVAVPIAKCDRSALADRGAIRNLVAPGLIVSLVVTLAAFIILAEAVNWQCGLLISWRTVRLLLPVFLVSLAVTVYIQWTVRGRSRAPSKAVPADLDSYRNSAAMPHLKYPHYRKGLTRHAKDLLQFTASDIAPQILTPIDVAQYILDHRDFVPNDDVIRRLEKALYLRHDYFKKGEGTGRPFTNEQAKERLKRYESLFGGVLLIGVITKGRHKSTAGLSDKEIAAIVERVEWTLLNEMASDQLAWGGDK